MSDSGSPGLSRSNPVWALEQHTLEVLQSRATPCNPHTVEPETGRSVSARMCSHTNYREIANGPVLVLSPAFISLGDAAIAGRTRAWLLSGAARGADPFHGLERVLPYGKSLQSRIHGSGGNRTRARFQSPDATERLPARVCGNVALSKSEARIAYSSEPSIFDTRRVRLRRPRVAPESRRLSHVKGEVPTSARRSSWHGGIIGGPLALSSPAVLSPQTLGLKALRVVPRAPNFWALRRVSSNLDRAYVSTSWPVSIRSKPWPSRSLAYAASSSAPAIQPVQRSMLRRPSALTGFWIVTSATCMRPPGASTGRALKRRRPCQGPGR